MPTMMRLQRHGKKGRPFYHIVIADGRAPRDGRFIEKIGTYNPIPNPAEIILNFEKALDWLQRGAQPTDTVRNILSFKGVLYKHHLIKGLKKGALTEAEVEVKFQAWLKEKEAKIEAKRSGLAEKSRADKKAAFEAETKVKEAREAELAKRRADAIEAQVKEAQVADEAVTEVDASTEEEMLTKEAVAEKVEESSVKEEVEVEVEAEVKEEEKVEEKKEDVKEKAEKKVEEKEEEKAEVKEENKKEAEGEKKEKTEEKEADEKKKDKE
ncbi:MAG: 30S ribosomal protein S16 [Bacteroidales bacterium]|jgi:small subunit ribosomal protein S16|nr:30S ribosomal protein S16 [Bacteroidales bacterium]